MKRIFPRALCLITLLAGTLLLPSSDHAQLLFTAMGLLSHDNHWNGFVR